MKTKMGNEINEKNINFFTFPVYYNLIVKDALKYLSLMKERLKKEEELKK